MGALGSTFVPPRRILEPLSVDFEASEPRFWNVWRSFLVSNEHRHETSKAHQATMTNQAFCLQRQQFEIVGLISDPPKIHFGFSEHPLSNIRKGSAGLAKRYENRFLKFSIFDFLIQDFWIFSFCDLSSFRVFEFSNFREEARGDEKRREDWGRREET